MSHTVLRRTYATGAPFVPPQSLENVHQAPLDTDGRRKPASPTFYTARSDFYDGIRLLEDALKSSQRALRAVHLMPFPDAVKAQLPPAHTAWKNKEGIAAALGCMLSTSRHRRVQGLLNQLNDMRRIATTGAEDGIAARIGGVLEAFERADKAAHLTRGRRKPARFDEYGRTYTLGKRKESAARVWMIPVRSPEAEAEAEADTASGGVTTGPLQVTTILVNGLPLATYFPNVVDRQRIVRPFKLTGLFGAFNVFALVRGGGTTGQAGALAHGIAKGLAAHVPDVEIILRRGMYLSLHNHHALKPLHSQVAPAGPAYGRT